MISDAGVGTLNIAAKNMYHNSAQLWDIFGASFKKSMASHV